MHEYLPHLVFRPTLSCPVFLYLCRILDKRHLSSYASVSSLGQPACLTVKNCLRRALRTPLLKAPAIIKASPAIHLEL